MGRILCVIDSLGSGGAQRQMVNLICGLKEKGHDVEMFVYFPELDFFRAQLDAASITVHEVRKQGGFSLKVLAHLTRLLRVSKYDAVLSFLESPNIYVELARIFSFANVNLIVSERGSFSENPGLLAKAKRLLHLFADSVVTNSFTQAKWLERFPWVRGKLSVIYNGYTIPEREIAYATPNESGWKLLAVGRVDGAKNGVNLIQALVLLSKTCRYLPTVYWAGRQQVDPRSLQVRAEMDQLLMSNPDVASKWHWLGERNDVPRLLSECHALIHVSLFEGLPNVICEAFIEGRPVIASNVCDHPLLVKDGLRGILCDPRSPASICEGIEKLTSMSLCEYRKLGENARKYAMQFLTIDRMVDQYEALAFNEILD